MSDPVAAVYPTLPKALRRASETSSLLNLYWRFFIAGLTRHSQTGALIPSQRFLIDQMIAPVPASYQGQVIELGAGTGVLTLRLALKRPSCHVLACEINPELAAEVQTRIAAAGLQSRVRVVSNSADEVLKKLQQQPVRERADFVLSGIPLGNLGKKRAIDLVERISGGLKPGGMYIQFQHSLLDRRKIKQRFSTLRTVPVLLNFPPAFVYYAWK